MKKLLTIHGDTILVDDEDYDKAKQYRWVLKSDSNSPRHRVYTYSGVKRGTSYKKLILGLDSKMTLFKNDNPLDLRKKNIMIFDTRSEFISTMGKLYRKKNPEFNHKISKGAQGKGGKSTKKNTYLGVHCDNPIFPHPWISIIKFNRKNHYLGSYAKEEYAALAYDKKALEIYGIDAIRNFPDLTLKELIKKLEKIKKEDAVIFLDHLSKKRQGQSFENIEKTSKYTGVCRKKGSDLWRATIFFHNKQYSLGNYDTQEEAAHAYDKKALEIYGKNAKLNFPHLASSKLKKIKEKFKEIDDKKFDKYISKQTQGVLRDEKKTSGYVGVYLRSNKNIWIAKITYKRKTYYLGDFNIEEEAALAYDKKALELYGSEAKLNKPNITLEQIAKKRERLAKIKAKNTVISRENLSKHRQGTRYKNASKLSKYVGIHHSYKGAFKWHARITYRNKEYFLGSFDTEKEAAQAYDKKALEIYGEDAKLNFPKKKINNKK